jgi:hypothetical protein
MLSVMSMSGGRSRTGELVEIIICVKPLLICLCAGPRNFRNRLRILKILTKKSLQLAKCLHRTQRMKTRSFLARKMVRTPAPNLSKSARMGLEMSERGRLDTSKSED